MLKILSSAELLQVSVHCKNRLCGGALFGGVIHCTNTSPRISIFFNTWYMTGRSLALPEGEVRSLLIPLRWRVSIWSSGYRLLNLSASEGKRNCRLVWSLREFSPVLNFADFAVSREK